MVVVEWGRGGGQRGVCVCPMSYTATDVSQRVCSYTALCSLFSLFSAIRKEVRVEFPLGLDPFVLNEAAAILATPGPGIEEYLGIREATVCYLGIDRYPAGARLECGR